MHATFRRRLRPAFGLAAALLLPMPALHAEPVPASTFLSAYEADLRLLYDEARAIGADNFVFYLYMNSNESVVRTLAAELAAKPQVSLHGVLRLQPQQMRAYATPAVLRDELRKLRPGSVSPVFQPFRGQWALVELKTVETGQPMPDFPALRDSLLRLVGIRALPDAATLRARSPEQQESASLSRVTSTQAFDQLPPGIDVNKPLASGYTLLQRALREDALDLVKALLARHADPNRCYQDACPLQIALDSKTNALTYTNLLLEAGAKPDQLPGLPGDNSALVMAVQRGQLDVVKALLAKGADASGKDSRLKPLDVALASNNTELQKLLLSKGVAADDRNAPSLLHEAMARGNRELATTLLDKGADPLARRPLPGSDKTGTPLEAALAAGRPDDAAWLRDLLRKKLAAKGRYQWSAWVEQEVLAPPSKDPNAPLVQIVRQPLKSGARLTLNRERFTLHVRLHPEAELRLEAVTGPKFFAELNGGVTAPLFDRKRIRHAASRPGPLLVGEAGARATAPASTGGLLALAPDKARCDRVDRAPEGPVCVRIIDSVRLDRGAGEVELTLEKSGLRELDLVLGTAVDYGETLGDLVNAQKTTLVFR